MTTVNQKTVSDQAGQEIVVGINAATKLYISFQRTGVDSAAVSVSAIVTESDVHLGKGFPTSVSKAEQDAIIKAASDMLVSNVFGN